MVEQAFDLVLQGSARSTSRAPGGRVGVQRVHEGAPVVAHDYRRSSSAVVGLEALVNRLPLSKACSRSMRLTPAVDGGNRRRRPSNRRPAAAAAQCSRPSAPSARRPRLAEQTQAAGRRLRRPGRRRRASARRAGGCGRAARSVAASVKVTTRICRGVRRPGSRGPVAGRGPAPAAGTARRGCRFCRCRRWPQSGSCRTAEAQRSRRWGQPGLRLGSRPCASGTSTGWREQRGSRVSAQSRANSPPAGSAANRGRRGQVGVVSTSPRRFQPPIEVWLAACQAAAQRLRRWPIVLR